MRTAVIALALVVAACSSQDAAIPNMTQERWTHLMQSIGTVTYETPVPIEGKRASTKQMFRCELYDKLAPTYPNAVCAGYLLRDRDDKINAIELQLETKPDLGYSIIDRLFWKAEVPKLVVERAEQKPGLGTDVVHAGVHYDFMVKTMGPGAIVSLSLYAD